MLPLYLRGVCNEGERAMKFPKQAVIASGMLLAMTAFAQVSRPVAPAMGSEATVSGTPRAGVGSSAREEATLSGRSSGADARVHGSAKASPSDAQDKASAEAATRVEAQKRAMAASAGVGARMETEMGGRR
jgi:hypothetical protein